MDDELTEYELERLDQIARNKQRLAELGLVDAVRSIAKRAKQKRPRKTPAAAPPPRQSLLRACKASEQPPSLASPMPVPRSPQMATTQDDPELSPRSGWIAVFESQGYKDCPRRDEDLGVLVEGAVSPGCVRNYLRRLPDAVASLASLSSTFSVSLRASLAISSRYEAQVQSPTVTQSHTAFMSHSAIAQDCDPKKQAHALLAAQTGAGVKGQAAADAPAGEPALGAVPAPLGHLGPQRPRYPRCPPVAASLIDNAFKGAVAAGERWLDHCGYSEKGDGVMSERVIHITIQHC